MYLTHLPFSLFVTSCRSIFLKRLRKEIRILKSEVTESFICFYLLIYAVRQSVRCMAAALCVNVIEIQMKSTISYLNKSLTSHLTLFTMMVCRKESQNTWPPESNRLDIGIYSRQPRTEI